MNYLVLLVLIPAGVSFAIGMLFAPVLRRMLCKYKAWKKTPGKTALDGSTATEFNRLHQASETSVPRMGGIVIWGSVAITTISFALLGYLFPNSLFSDLNFLSRSQTWIPFCTLIVGALVGLVDDLATIQEGGQGMRLRHRLLIVVALSLFIGWWFWAKLAVVAIDIPHATPLFMGWTIIPFFVLISLALYASGVIDGIDGLSGGVLAPIFGSYAVIAFVQHEANLAAFCAVVAGGILAFLWHNIPPARFYMSDTGTMGLTLTIAVVAFMSDNLSGGIGVFVLPIIGALLAITVASNILQVFWKKVFHKKLLRIAPLHHHFEAIGWPSHSVVMRYWILALVFASLGIIIALTAA